MSVRLQISALRTDGGTQSRASIDDAVVDEYAELYKAGAAFPDVVVFYDGESYWVADGFHRIAAARAVGHEDIRVDVKQGSVRDARLFSAGANAAHGLKRTNADKRRAVTMVLSDDEWRAKSDRWIAEQCGVDHKFVGKVRDQLGTVPSSDPPPPKRRSDPPTTETDPTTEKRMGRDGKARAMPVRCEPVEQAQARTYGDGGASRREVGEANAAKVLPLITDGHSQAEVARMLGVSPSVVSNAVARNTKTNPLERLLAYVEEVEGVIALWSTNFQPKWETADSEQRDALLAGVKAMVAATNSFTRRLKESGSPK